VSIPTTSQSGKHRVKFKYVNKRMKLEMSREFTFDVVNDGNWEGMTVRDSLQKKYRKVLVLQNGRECSPLKLSKYEGTKDTYMHATHRVNDRNTDFVNYGSVENLAVGSYGQEKRTLIKFDLSKFPKKTVVAEAYLQMYLYSWPGRGGLGKGTFEAYQVLKPWSAGKCSGSRWVKPPINEGEASWNCNQHPNKWTKGGCGEPGADRAGSPMHAETVDKKKKIWVTWKIDPKVVKEWIDNPSKNHGILLTNKGRQGTFRSSDFHDKGMRPRLVLAIKSGI
jgi:hypothetical protein